MEIHLDDKKTAELLQEYHFYKGDESYVYHLANYLIEELEKQTENHDNN